MKVALLALSCRGKLGNAVVYKKKSVWRNEIFLVIFRVSGVVDVQYPFVYLFEHFLSASCFVWYCCYMDLYLLPCSKMWAKPILGSLVSSRSQISLVWRSCKQCNWQILLSSYSFCVRVPLPTLRERTRATLVVRRTTLFRQSNVFQLEAFIWVMKRSL